MVEALITQLRSTIARLSRELEFTKAELDNLRLQHADDDASQSREVSAGLLNSDGGDYDDGLAIANIWG